MKVILIENIERLGKTGDVINVKDGYARNYLIPNNKAKAATAGNMKILDVLKSKQVQEDKKKMDEIKAVADRISNISLTIGEEAGEEEKLYGSITSEMISNALREEEITVDKKDIILDEPIKKLGVYQVTVKLHPEVKANLRVWVVKK